jgi:hypothetical protein
MDTEADIVIPFLFIRKKTSLATKVYREPTYTGRYLNFKCNPPPHIKRKIIQSLHNRASTICQKRQDLFNGIGNLRCDLQLNDYPLSFTDSVINSNRSTRPNQEEKSLGSVHIPYVKGISKMFKRIGNNYNIRTNFKTKHTLVISLMRTTREEIRSRGRSECGRSYIGETGRPLAVRLRKHRHNLKGSSYIKIKISPTFL